jgi:hypothetical protein
MTGFLHSVSSPAAKTAKEIKAVQDPPAAPAAPEPPAKSPTAQMPAAVAQPQPAAAAAACPFCQAKLTPGAQYCLACGRKLAASSPSVAQAADLSVRLRLVRGYGREDSTYPVGPNGITLGRSMAVVNISEDPYLSPVHMLLRTDGAKLLVEDHKSLNGTFLRVRSQAELRQGAEFIAGSQRFVLLGLGGPTTDVRTPAAPDTRPYGGPLPRQLFVALRLLGRQGPGRRGHAARRADHLHRPARLRSQLPRRRPHGPPPSGTAPAPPRIAGQGKRGHQRNLRAHQ